MHTFGVVLLMIGAGLLSGATGAWMRSGPPVPGTDKGRGLSAVADARLRWFCKWASVVGLPVGLAGLVVVLVTG